MSFPFSLSLQVFATQENLKMLCSSEKIFMDGTFKIVPTIFEQLYTVHGKYCGQVFPFIFCLMQNRTKASYIALFESIKRLCAERYLNFNPKTAMIDFEKAAIKGLNETCQDTEIKGCLFHFTQCILRKVSG